jgi:hypothetical protein
MSLFRPLLALAGTIALIACGSSAAPGLDGGGTPGLDGGPALDGGAPLDGGAVADGGPHLDGGAHPDGGPALDGGPAADGGTPDAGPPGDGGCPFDGGCPATGCADITGSYQSCIFCAGVGGYGPFTTEVDQVCGCQFTACAAVGDGGNATCGNGCIAQNGGLQFVLSVFGFSVNCSGMAADGGATFVCPLASITTCVGKWSLGAPPTCQ